MFAGASMGFFGKLAQGWGFIKEAFKMGFENRTLFKPSIYLVVTTIVYLLIWVGALIALDIDFEQNEAAAILIGAACTFGSFLIFYFFSGMTVNMVDAHLEGKTPDLREAYRDARQNFAAICTLAVVSTIVSMIVRALRGDSEGGGNIVGRIVAGIVERLWTILTFLLLPAIIIEDISLGQALRRVRELHRENVLMIAIGDVAVGFITGLLGFLVVLLIGGVAYGSMSIMGGTAGLVVAITIGGTMLALFAAFTTFVRMAYYTCLYLWARDVEKQGSNAPAPLPLARALRR